MRQAQVAVLTGPFQNYLYSKHDTQVKRRVCVAQNSGRKFPWPHLCPEETRRRGHILARTFDLTLLTVESPLPLRFRAFFPFSTPVRPHLIHDQT